MRRGAALKFQKDFKLAKADFEEAIKLEDPKKPSKDGGAKKWLVLVEDDRVHEEKLQQIM